MLPRALHLAVCLLFTGPSVLVSAPSPDAKFWMQLQRFITTAKQQPTLTSSSPFGRQLEREQEGAFRKFIDSNIPVINGSASEPLAPPDIGLQWAPMI